MAVRRLLLGAASLVALLGVRWAGTPDSDTDVVETGHVGEGAALCQQAVSRLRLCCPGLEAPTLDCTYRREHHVAGCSGSGTALTVRQPALSLDESRGILETSCADLEARRCRP